MRSIFGIESPPSPERAKFRERLNEQIPTDVQRADERIKKARDAREAACNKLNAAKASLDQANPSRNGISGVELELSQPRSRGRSGIARCPPRFAPCPRELRKPDPRHHPAGGQSACDRVGRRGRRVRKDSRSAFHRR